ncbi:hypothetical protein B296_00058988 [Ensete ventricosum]|uniref:Uncharacterized protein n=1 Tax=Ensete ventricosum TaxID=4639 RepID=A0A426X180_ENSVE|nr:hypothetical protein B296_00058988 [Ensete ventricosum]
MIQLMCVESTWQDSETRRRLTRRSGFAGSRLLGLGVDRIGFERYQEPTRRLSSRVCARRDPSDDCFSRFLGGDARSSEKDLPCKLQRGAFIPVEQRGGRTAVFNVCSAFDWTEDTTLRKAVLSLVFRVSINETSDREYGVQNNRRCLRPGVSELSEYRGGHLRNP